jgi:uncharacterized protein (TIGR03089 family)
MSLSPVPSDVPSLLRALRASDPGRPRITWYGPDGERIELSAHVLDNWVAKTANLLVEELDADEGTRVLIDLPPHWRTAVWALATWAVGGEVLPADNDLVDPDVVVTDHPANLVGLRLGDPRIVVVALPALARSVNDAPAGAFDYNAEVGTFGDEFEPFGEPTRLPATDVLPYGTRLLVSADEWSLEESLVAPLRVDGSLVLCHDDVADLDRVAEVEHAVQ